MHTSDLHFAKHSFDSLNENTLVCSRVFREASREGELYPLLMNLHGRGSSTSVTAKPGSDVLRSELPRFVSERLRSP